MRFHVVLEVGTMPRIQVAEATLREGHVIVRHWYKTGIPAKPRARVVTHTTRYECSCGREWYGRKPTNADLLRHDEVMVS
jgi:hypothetical protein